MANKSITKSNDILDKFKISNVIKKEETAQSVNEPNTFIKRPNINEPNDFLKRPVAEVDVETKFIKSLVDRETSKFKTNVVSDESIGNIVETKTITANTPSLVPIKEKTELKNTDFLLAVTDLIKNMSTTNNNQFDVNTLVNGLKNGLKDVHFNIQLDPTQVDKEIKFRGNGLNT